MPRTCKVNGCTPRYNRNKQIYSVFSLSWKSMQFLLIKYWLCPFPGYLLFLKVVVFFFYCCFFFFFPILPSSIYHRSVNYGCVFERSCQDFFLRNSYWKYLKTVENSWKTFFFPLRIKGNYSFTALIQQEQKKGIPFFMLLIKKKTPLTELYL